MKKARDLGGELLSQDLAVQVPSSLTVFASVFGMGTGGTLSHIPPRFRAFFSFFEGLAILQSGSKFQKLLVIK